MFQGHFLPVLMFRKTKGYVTAHSSLLLNQAHNSLGTAQQTLTDEVSHHSNPTFFYVKPSPFVLFNYVWSCSLNSFYCHYDLKIRFLLKDRLLLVPTQPVYSQINKCTVFETLPHQGFFFSFPRAYHLNLLLIISRLFRRQSLHNFQLSIKNCIIVIHLAWQLLHTKVTSASLLIINSFVSWIN